MDCLIFNHHSLPFDNREAADAALPDFLKTCIEAKNAGLKTMLVDQSMDSSWFSLELAPNYFWREWHNNHKKGSSKEVIKAFRSIATQSPFFYSDDITDGVDLFEVLLDGKSDYSALQAAAWHESPLTSFETRPPWNFSPLRVTINHLNPSSSEIESNKAEIPNFYNHSTFRQYLPKLLEEISASISSGREIVNGFEELYPGLLLCGKAIQQLNNWSTSVTLFKQVKQSLLALSQFAKKWETAEVEFYHSEALRKAGLPFQVSGESETVGNNPALRREREFFLPSGQQKFFRHHIKMSSGYRLHFYPDEETHKIFVGYIGPHLRLK